MGEEAYICFHLSCNSERKKNLPETGIRRDEINSSETFMVSRGLE